METQAIREKADTFIAALHALEEAEGDGGDALDALVNLYAPDATLTNAALALTGESRTGTDQIRAFWSDYKKTLGKAFSHFHQITASENAAGLFWTTKGTGADHAEGSAEYDGVTLLVFGDDGKISQFRGYYDTQQLNRAVGMEK